MSAPFSPFKKQHLSNEEWDRIEREYPSGPCPTCYGRGSFMSIGGTLEQCDCNRQKWLQRRYFSANIGRQYHSIGLDNLVYSESENIVNSVNAYLDNFMNNFYYGIGLTFAGPQGTGKTLAMCHILKELVKKDWSVYFIPFVDLIDTWGSKWKDNVAKSSLEERLKRTHILGIDDLFVGTGSQALKDFVRDAFEGVVRFRYHMNLPTLITTNLDLENQAKSFPRVFSLLSQKNRVIVTRGPDHRINRPNEQLDLALSGVRLPL